MSDIETAVEDGVTAMDLLKEILESLGKVHAKLDNAGIVKDVEQVAERVIRL